jgi:polyphosphate kinase
MYRNFFRRIESCFPVLDARLKRRVYKEGLEPYLKDNCQAWEMQSDGSYRQKKAGRAQIFSAQAHLLAEFGQELAREQ